MSYFKYGIFIPCFLFIVSCVTPPAPVPVPVEKDYETRRDNDEDRVETIKRAKDRSKGPICKGDDDCEDICKDIYRSRRAKTDCEELSVSQVEEFKTLFETLEDPDFDDLEEIDLDALDVFININIRSFDTLVGKYNKRDAKNVLNWIATNEDVATLLEKEDDDYEILSTLLGKLGTTGTGTGTATVTVTGTPFDTLASNIDGIDNFMDIAVESDNEPALEWVHEYLEEKACGGNLETKVCFDQYCTLAVDMDDNNAYKLAGFEFFEDYLNNIIEEEVNGDPDTADGAEAPGIGFSWDADPGSLNRIEDLDELNNWWEDLC